MATKSGRPGAPCSVCLHKADVVFFSFLFSGVFIFVFNYIPRFEALGGSSDRSSAPGLSSARLRPPPLFNNGYRRRKSQEVIAAMAQIASHNISRAGAARAGAGILESYYGHKSSQSRSGRVRAVSHIIAR